MKGRTALVARPYRLREDADVRRVRSRGRAVAHGPLVLRYLPNGQQPPRNRYTVIAGKKCGNSVQRNRQKRLVREALRAVHPSLAPGFDIAVICRGDRQELPSLEVARKSLAQILQRTDLVHGPLPDLDEDVTAAWRIDADVPEPSPR